MNTTMLRIAKPAFAILLATVLFTACKKDDTEPVDPEPEYRKEVLLSPFPNILSNPAGSTYGQLLVLTPAGDTIWKKDLPTGAHDFKRWVVNRQVRYSYLEYKIDPVINLQGNLVGDIVILNQDFNEIQRIKLLANQGRPEHYADGHDFIMLGDNHYILMSYYSQTVDNIPTSFSPNPNCKVVVNIVQEVENGIVLWEWNSGQHPELYKVSVESNNYQDDTKPQDYLHMNSMFVDPNDNNLICSFRNSDQIMKLNRQNGKIIWKLGGIDGDFPLASNEQFYRQHHVTIADDNETLLVFDNGDADKRPYSRILEFKLDEIAKKVTGFKSYTLPAFCRYMGSVEKTDNSYFVSGGSTPTTWEIDLATGRILWTKQISSNSYRVYRYL